MGSEMCIRDSQKAAHEAGVLGHGVRLLRAFPELGSKGYRHDCEKWPDTEPKRSSGKEGSVRCEGLRRWFGRCMTCLLYTSDAADE